MNVCLVFIIMQMRGCASRGSIFLNVVNEYIDTAILVLDCEGGGNPTFGNNDFSWCKEWCDTLTAKTDVNPFIYIQQSALNLLQRIGDFGFWVVQYANKAATGYKCIHRMKVYILVLFASTVQMVVFLAMQEHSI